MTIGDLKTYKKPHVNIGGIALPDFELDKSDVVINVNHASLLNKRK